MNKEITIYDIAKKVGTSSTTVSRALKDHPSISKKMIEKVKLAAKEMGYRPNTFAANLRKQKTNTIGVLIPRISSNFMAQAISGIESVAQDEGYNVIISQSNESEESEKENAETLFKSRIDGLIASLTYKTKEYSHFNMFEKKDIPVVLFDRVFKETKAAKITINNFEAAYEATTHLISQGCKKIAYIGGNTNRDLYKDRLEGFLKALQDNKLKIHEELILETDLSLESGNEAAKKLLSGKSIPDGIFTARDLVAICCIQFCTENKIRVPKDVAIVGFNNDLESRIVSPPLSTIDYKGEEMGKYAAKSLIESIKSKKLIISAESIQLRTSLIVRESSKKLS